MVKKLIFLSAYVLVSNTTFINVIKKKNYFIAGTELYHSNNKVLFGIVYEPILEKVSKKYYWRLFPRPKFFQIFTQNFPSNEIWDK